MKGLRLILSAIVALALAVPQYAAAQSNRKVLVAGVAFYNLENLFDTIPNNPEGRDLEFTPDGAKQWNGAKYREKLHNMAYAISNFTSRTTPLGPAIIGISEIENATVVQDLIDQPELAKWKLKFVHHDSPDARGVDVGLIYNPAYFKVENVTNHRLTALKFRTRDQMCVVGRLLGQRVAVVVNHWPSRLGGQERSAPSRNAAAALSKSIADSLWRVDPNMGVIIMGDLNDDPMDESCAKVLGAKKKAKGVEPHGFYNPWWEMLDKGIGTLAYKSQWNLFDQIIISGNLVNTTEDGLTFFDARVLSFDFLKGNDGNRVGYPKRTFSAGSYLGGYSDHFPTEIFLRKYVENKK